MKTIVRVLLALAVLWADQTQAYQRCIFDANTERKLITLLEPNVLACPGFLDQHEIFCCYTPKKDTYYCCDGVEFSLKVLLPVLLILLIFGLVIGCVCKMCLPSCKKRGTVHHVYHGAPSRHYDSRV